MERNADSPIDNLAKDIRLLILSFSDLKSAIRLIQTSKAWYECSVVNHVWKQIYLDNFDEFNPKPSVKTKDWKDEIKKKIALYGHNYDDYRDLAGKLSISFKIEPPMDFEIDAHIHRPLYLKVNDELLPCMGYFGPNDVCYGDWITEVFEELYVKFIMGTHQSDHVWDFCDQGMPAFQFTREGPICKVTLVEGVCTGEVDPEWPQDFQFLIEDFRVEYLKFLEELHKELLANYGADGKKFWDKLKLYKKN